ncbi:diketogulonate reductase-like aldo/keto reductase [Chryseobacterium sp. JUb7]|nr:diketogulonate reductase-like aldo/keto reductase [Chryseobacterium sp. JUb7]
MLLNPAKKMDNSKQAVIIPKSANVKRMNENFNVSHFGSYADGMLIIKSLNNVELNFK